MNVPKLRFKEFTGEWEITCLKDVITRINRVSDDFAPSMMITADSGFVLQSEKYSKDMTGESLKKYITLFKGELAYNHGASKLRPYGSTFVLNEERAKVPFVYHCFAINKGITDFYGLYLNRWEFGKKLKPLISSSARLDGLLNISFESFTNIKVNTPNFTEQEKIADFLNLVGEKINIQKDIVASLEKQNKGLMQKIFSQELRFKDDNGKEFPAWEDKKLGEVAKIYDGTHQTPNYVDNGIKFVSVEDIRCLYDSNKFITVEAFNSNFKVYPQKGDILMTRIGDIGTATLVNGDEPIAYYVSLALMKPFGILGKFLLQYIKSNDFQHELWRRTLHIAFPKKINKNEIGECLVMVPCKREQEKIAELLSSYDDKIEVEKKSLEKWQQIKKGLLQQMFV